MSEEIARWEARNSALRRSELERWQADIASGDPRRVANAARDLANAKDEIDPEWIFTITDKWWTPTGEIGEHLMEASGTDPRNKVPSATIKQMGSSPHIGAMMNCRKSMVGVKVETAGLKWAFYVKKHTYKLDKGEWTSTAELRGIWDVLNYWVVWPSWWLPIQAQPFSHAVFFGPMVTCLENMMTECALRIQSGIWEFVNNALSLNPDLRAWFGRLLQSNGNIFEMLKTPAYIVRTNPFVDTSPLWGKTIRMETCGSVITNETKPYGVVVDVDLWEPGDEQPDAWANLTQPTYVIRVRDMSQIEGPTKTPLDSVLRTTVDLAGSLFGQVEGLLQQAQGMEGVFVAPVLGLNFITPWVMLEAPEPGKRGGLLTCEIVDHSPEGWQHIIGGKCVSGDTLVHTADGLVEARSLVGKDVMTLSQDGVYRPAKWKSYGSQELFRVTFDNGDHILATNTHEWVVVDRTDRVITLDLIGERVPRVARADRYGQPDYLAPSDESVSVVSVEATGRIETVYCCEEPVTNTWVAGDGYLTSNSPKWLNDLMNAFYAYLIDMAMIALGFTGVPSNLLEGFLNDAFFAFQLLQLYERRDQMGPYHPAMERFYATGAPPYNIEALFTFLKIIWESRGWTSVVATFRNGEIYTLGKDFFRGMLFSIVYMGRTRMVTDYVEMIMWRINEREREILAQIGDGEADEPPIAKHTRNITALQEIANVITLAPNS